VLLMTIEKSTIWFTRNQNRKDFVSNIISKFKDRIKGNVLLKVNLVSHNPYPTTTHPEMIEAVFENIKDVASEIAVGDAHGVDLSSSKMENCDNKKKCEELGIKYINFYEHRFKKIKSPRGFGMKVSVIPFEYDYIISLPNLKDHFMLRMTNALKDKFGYLTRGERLKMHSRLKNIHKGTAELNSIFKSDLIICDAIKTLVKAQEHRHGGIEKDLGYIFAGTDPVALDFYGFTLLKPISVKLEKIDNPLKIKYIKYAVEYGLGSQDYNLEEI